MPEKKSLWTANYEIKSKLGNKLAFEKFRKRWIDLCVLLFSRADNNSTSPSSLLGGCGVAAPYHVTNKKKQRTFQSLTEIPSNVFLTISLSFPSRHSYRKIFRIPFILSSSFSRYYYIIMMIFHRHVRWYVLSLVSLSELKFSRI